MSEVTDKELFDAAVSDTPVETPETTEQPEATGEVARDAQGRFAAKTETAETPEPVAAAPEPAPKPVEQDHRVPLRELLDERERRQDLQRRVAAYEAAQRQQKQPEPPDFFVDPSAAIEHRLNPLQRDLQNGVGQVREDFSKLYAVDKYGEEVVGAAYADMEKIVNQFGPNHPDYIKVMQSSHPYGELVKWHKEQQTKARINGDLDGFLKKREDELLDDPAFLARVAEKLRGAPAGKPSPVSIPPSLNRQTAAMGRTADEGDLSNESLYRHATG